MPPTRKSRRTVIGARGSTDKLQVFGYRLMVSRIEQALVSRDVRDFGSPFVREKSAVWTGVGLMLVIALAGLVVGFLSPAGKAGDAKILATKAGARYVVVDGRVHPVTNLASARLIAGSDDNAKNVGDKDLAKFPRGQLMGIPGAPDEMKARTDDPASWSVCSQADLTSSLDLTKQVGSVTAVVAGGDALTGQGRVPAGHAVLVSSAAPSAGGSESRVTWLLIDGHRMPISDEDRALMAVLRLTSVDLEEAAPVSAATIESIPPAPVFSRPSFAGTGATSKAVDFKVGSVLVVDGLDGPERWVVLTDGLQKIGPFAAELLLSTGSEALRGVSRETVAAATHTSIPQLAGWPWDVPPVLQKQSTVCYRWERGAGGKSDGWFTAGATLPVTEQARRDVAWLLPARSRTPQADAFYTTPGKGWLVRASGSTEGSQVEGQVWWVGDNGVRFAIAGDKDTPVPKVVEMLGIGGAVPMAVPWPTLALLPVGGSLSPQSARVVHATIPIDKAQGVAPEGKDLN